MSAKDNENKGCDYLIMDVDGTNKSHLTYFNDPPSEWYSGKQMICADSIWGSNGSIIRYVHEVEGLLKIVN